MDLSEAQIERYSRQIIVSGFGGRAQERLRAARIAIVGDTRDLAAPILYLAAAGAGAVAPILTDAPPTHDFIAEAAGVNSDCTIDASAAAPGRMTLALMIAAGAASLAAAQAILQSAGGVPCVFARIDSPPRIGVFPGARPCPRCAHELLDPAGARDANAGIVAMTATVEALKLAAGYESDPRAALVEFAGLASRIVALKSNPECVCAGGAG
jgi:adenylyltransferase/sulfurtransferase